VLANAKALVGERPFEPIRAQCTDLLRGYIEVAVEGRTERVSDVIAYLTAMARLLEESCSTVTVRLHGRDRGM
jgi:hypothetical protein